MLNKSWGINLLNLYGIFLILIFIITQFDFWEAVVWGSYPLILLFKSTPDSVIYIMINFGLYGISVICVVIQALILFYTGNALQKLFQKFSNGN